eukprot:scaffold51457_cov33-Tisochrysis_lutea.AAC.4
MCLSFTLWPHGEGPGDKSLEIASSRMNVTKKGEAERGASEGQGQGRFRRYPSRCRVRVTIVVVGIILGAWH